MICQVTHEQKRDWVALWNKPIWILLSLEHLVSLILWKVSIPSIRARLECWLASALGANCMQQLELEEGDSWPSAVQKERGKWAQRESPLQQKPHSPRSGYLIPNQTKHRRLQCWRFAEPFKSAKKRAMLRLPFAEIINF